MSRQFCVETEQIGKTVTITDGRITQSVYHNKLRDTRTSCAASECAIAYRLQGGWRTHILRAENMQVTQVTQDAIELQAQERGIRWQVTLHYAADQESGVLRKTAEVRCDKPSVRILYIELDSMQVPQGFSWTIPKVKKRVFIPAYVTTMGQPYYIGDLFFGGEFPTVDNRIEHHTAFSRYHIDRTFAQIAKDGVYTTVPFVMGAGEGDTFEQMRARFFRYVATIARPARFRMQFNSWYDHMLDITSDKIVQSFVSVADGLERAGLRPLDCYVVDDGWTDYTRPAFWEFDRSSFKDEFYNECELTRSLRSTFGVWFGPRGGYTTQTPIYAGHLASIGYPMCKQSKDICTANPRYIHDLCDRMAEFCTKYNVTYFKIDGFAITPCRNILHGHPRGKGDGLAFYTFLWEEWMKGFARIRKACPDVFLNVTSYAHCSPWFLTQCDAVWINNSSDMGYEGKGDNLAQCLNYRDGRYYDFFERRQLQFPVAYIYNHEPTYAERNCNPPLTSNFDHPGKAHPTVVYSHAQFEDYLYACMMRGSGFVEMYFSPSMFDDKRWKIVANVMQWAEKNFRILRNSRFFGTEPVQGGVYGYYARDGKDAWLWIRNSSDRVQQHTVQHAQLALQSVAYTASRVRPSKGEERAFAPDEPMLVTLQPYEMQLYRIRCAE